MSARAVAPLGSLSLVDSALRLNRQALGCRVGMGALPPLFACELPRPHTRSGPRYMAGRVSGLTQDDRLNLPEGLSFSLIGTGSWPGRFAGRFARYWCPERESNPHAFRLRILSPVCLPVSSSGRVKTTGYSLLLLVINVPRNSLRSAYPVLHRQGHR